jgi:hypothetical protein
MSSFEATSDSVLTRSWKFISWRAPWGLFAFAHTKHRRVRSVPESRKLRKISSCPGATGGSSVSCIPSRAKRSRLAPGWPGGFSLHPAVNCVSEQRSTDADRSRLTVSASRSQDLAQIYMSTYLLCPRLNDLDLPLGEPPRRSTIAGDPISSSAVYTAYLDTGPHTYRSSWLRRRVICLASPAREP